MTKFGNSEFNGKPTYYYNLDVIISVGYRVKSQNGILFRKWATNVLKDYMLKGYAINQRRLEYLEKAVKLIDIANRVDEKFENSDAKEILKVIGKYSKALDLLDDYDHKSLEKPKGSNSEKQIKYDDCIKIINKLRFNEESDIFAIERNKGLEAIIGNIYQTFDGVDVYKSVEEKAANFLYMIVKNHVFVDGNKRIAATLFIYFLNFYDILYKDNNHVVDNNTLASLTLLIAQSNPKEKEVIIEPATLTATAIDKIQATNKLKFYIQPSLENRKYKISGTAWLDANKNGQREETETLLPNMQVMLVYKENGKLVKDAKTDMPKKITTDENGKYEFLNLDKGEYLVVFIYDTEKYSVTEFNAQGVEPSINSDAIEFEMEIEGSNKKVAVSDVLKIEDTDIRDIDIGLYIAEKFDLKLDKHISKITLTTPTIGTQVYNKNNEKLSKVEVLNKNVGQSSFIVEYKIIVTNEGTAAGYVKKVVDYLPKEAKFNSELNKDWFLAKDGNAYNSILADVKLEPGQSKELTLVLSYNITEDLIGNIVNNNAEIYESYNEQGLQDIDSKAGNKIPTEDDMSNADIAVSIVTGKIVGYTTLTLFILAILVFGIYEIKKQVLDKKI